MNGTGMTQKTNANRETRAPTPPPTRPMPTRSWFLFLIILAANYLLIRSIFPRQKPATVPYTLFKEEVVKKNVARIYSRGERITGRFIQTVTYPTAPDTVRRLTPQPVTTFSTTVPVFVDPGLEALLIANGVEISAEPIETGNTWTSVLLSFLPALLLIGMYVWVFRRMSAQGGLGGASVFGLGKSTARRFDTDKDKAVTFDDVAGIDEAENELVEVVDFLKDPQKYTRLGGTAPKGILLVGPPGTGKTLLARAVAGHHLHRRTGLDRPGAGHGGVRRLERAGTDAEPDPGRDGWIHRT